MTVALEKRSNAELLEEVARLPERMTGEVIDGELYVMGRPTPGHQNVEGEVTGALRFGGGGKPPPPGWLILPEVEVRFPTLEQVGPDVSGWLRARLAGREHENPVVVRPDWVCEILSDSTRRKDLGPKRELYAAQHIPHLWIIDPEAHVLEAFALAAGRWSLLGTWSEDDVVTGVAPFPDAAFELTRWWLR